MWHQHTNRILKELPFTSTGLQVYGTMLACNIDKGLARFYYLTRTPYMVTDTKGKFLIWCEANEYDQESIQEELELDPSECALVEFDPDFPIKSGENTDKTTYIFNTIKYCANHPYPYF